MITREKNALEAGLCRFSNLYANTGAPWDECTGHAWFLYGQYRASGCGFWQALDKLDLEGSRYEDM